MAKKGEHQRCVKFKNIRKGGKTRKVCADFKAIGGWFGEPKKHGVAAKAGRVTSCGRLISRRPTLQRLGSNLLRQRSRLRQRS